MLVDPGPKTIGWPGPSQTRAGCVLIQEGCGGREAGNAWINGESSVKIWRRSNLRHL
jgi:hypothetical protein